MDFPGGSGRPPHQPQPLPPMTPLPLTHMNAMACSTMVVLIAGMAGACLYCARELWLSGTSRAWCLVAVMNLAMVAVHLPLSGSHHVTHAVAEAGVPQPTIMTLATALSTVEVLIAVAVLCYRTRGNAVLGEPR
jgi:hypothetical protein